MNICTLTKDLCARFGYEKGLDIIAAAGFESVDVSLFYPVDSGILTESDDNVFKYFTNIRKMVEERGMYVYQTHAPYPTFVEDHERNPIIYAALKKALLASSVLGARHSVVHPTHRGVTADGAFKKQLYSADKELVKETNIDFYSRLIPYLYEYDMKIAIENMWANDPMKKGYICPTVCSSPYEMVEYVDTMNSLCSDERFVACLDVGHTNLSCRDMPVREVVNVLGHRLKSLHVHDNDGLHDSHTAPGLGTVDWEGFCLGLRDVGYTGDFVYEAHQFHLTFDDEVVPYSAALLYQIARKMCDKYGL